MRFFRISGGILLCGMLFLTVQAKEMPVENYKGKYLLGEIETLRIVECDLTFKARIDTGATSTSVNTIDIEIEDAEKRKHDNKGKPIQFVVSNENGEECELSAKVERITKIRNPAGLSYRYNVDLTLDWRGIQKKIEVNLKNRNKLDYKLLIGRDFLAHDFLVDVSRNWEE
jgi:hypothetical protein